MSVAYLLWLSQHSGENKGVGRLNIILIALLLVILLHTLTVMDYLLPLVPDKIRNLPTHMDYDGQRRAERTFQVIIILFAVVGFIWGYICQQFSQTMYILCAGFLLSCVLTLPPWPIYRMKNLDWQKARITEETVDSSSTASSKSKGKKK